MDLQDYELIRLIKVHFETADLPLYENTRLIELLNEFLLRARYREDTFVQNRLRSLQESIDRKK